MSNLTITLPDGSSRTLADGATGADLAADIGPGLAKAALLVNVDGEGRDLDRPLDDGTSVSIVTAESDEGLHTLRHSTAHVLAQAVLDLWRAPGTPCRRSWRATSHGAVRSSTPGRGGSARRRSSRRRRPRGRRR